MEELIKVMKINFNYLIDEKQETVKDYKAQCTPDIYLLNEKHELVYHGRIDDNWQHPHKVTSHDLLNAVNALANGLPMQKEEDQKPSIGCSIKWND